MTKQRIGSYYKWKNLGLCVSCGKTPMKNSVRCEKCAEKNRLRTLAHYHKIRLIVFTHYCGGKPCCQCPGCRTTYIGFLQLDHVKGDGKSHCKKHKLGFGGNRTWTWVLKNGFPEGFQVLCANCNSTGGKRLKDQCPMHGKKH
jgi:hypothetical protein